MFIYNTTFHIDRECYSDFVAWLRNVYIPVTVQHGALSEPRLARIIVDEKRKAKMLHCNFCCGARRFVTLVFGSWRGAEPRAARKVWSACCRFFYNYGAYRNIICIHDRTNFCSAADGSRAYHYRNRPRYAHHGIWCVACAFRDAVVSGYGGDRIEPFR